MHDHVLNSEVKYLVDLGLVTEEVKVSPVQFLGEENVSCSDVSVSKSLLMKILHSKKYLPYHICGSLL